MSVDQTPAKERLRRFLKSRGIAEPEYQREVRGQGEQTRHITRIDVEFQGRTFRTTATDPRCRRADALASEDLLHRLEEAAAEAKRKREKARKARLASQKAKEQARDHHTHFLNGEFERALRMFCYHYDLPEPEFMSVAQVQHRFVGGRTSRADAVNSPHYACTVTAGGISSTQIRPRKKDATAIACHDLYVALIEEHERGTPDDPADPDEASAS